MATYILEVAAADLTANNDMIEKATQQWKPARNQSKPRIIRAAGLTGSAAAHDMQIRLEAGGKPLCNLYNTITGGPVDVGADIWPVGAGVPANTDFKAVITDAGGTNPAYLILIMDE